MWLCPVYKEKWCWEWHILNSFVIQIYCMSQLILLNLTLLGIIFAHLFSIPFNFVLAQSDDRAGNVKGNVVNSKYVTITDHRYQHGNTSDIITGTVRNNSTQEIPMISVIAVLYDRDNNLITTEIGSADGQDIPGGVSSEFSIYLFGLRENVIGHYILFPGGTSRLP
jgi:hypothetical protein